MTTTRKNRWLLFYDPFDLLQFLASKIDDSQTEALGLFYISQL